MRRSVYIEGFSHGNNPVPAASVIDRWLMTGAVFGTDRFTGKVPEPLGNRHRLTAPYQLFRCAGGRHLAVGCPNDGIFVKLCRVLGLDELPGDPRFAKYASRKQFEDELIPLIQAAIEQWDVEKLGAALEREGVPCSPVRNYEEVLFGPEGAERGLVVQAPHTGLGSYRAVRNPVLLDQGSPTIRLGPPLLGEHDAEIREQFALPGHPGEAQPR